MVDVMIVGEAVEERTDDDNADEEDSAVTSEDGASANEDEIDVEVEEKASKVGVLIELISEQARSLA